MRPSISWCRHTDNGWCRLRQLLMTQFGGDRSPTEEAAGNSCSSFRQGGRLVQPTIRLSCRPPPRSAAASDPISLPSKQVRFPACYFAHSDFASTTLFATSDNKRIWTGKRRKAAGGKKNHNKRSKKHQLSSPPFSLPPFPLLESSPPSLLVAFSPTPVNSTATGVYLFPSSLICSFKTFKSCSVFPSSAVWRLLQTAPSLSSSHND